LKENTMRIRWENIIIPALIITLIVLLFHMPEALRRLAADVGTVYRGTDNPTTGILALGIICVTIIGVAHILSNNRR
jgi:hypothetical protein